MQVHPSAIIDSRAVLGEEVVVGPHAVIEGPVKIGAHTQVLAGAVVTGQVEIGEHNRIGYGAVIGDWPQDLSFDPSTSSGVRIGSHNVIREHATIHRSTLAGQQTVLGDHNYLMAGAHLGHDCVVGNHNVIANNSLLGGHVSMADRCFIGGGCVFHQFTRIGSLVITQGISGFGKDLPPYVLAAGVNGVVGVNVVGLRRANFDREAREEIKEAFKMIYHSELNVRQALEQAEAREWGPAAQEFWRFLRQDSKRGLCGRGHSRHGGGG
ncbi:MAG: acyl-ACP--UDP-N-acetylglucosamine O-acyltransferase [Verrucomicrobiales bacterium]